MILTKYVIDAFQAYDSNTTDGPIGLEDGKAYVKFDQIEIMNARIQEPSKSGLLVGLKYKGIVTMFMATDGVELTNEKALSLNGITGRIEIRLGEE